MQLIKPVFSIFAEDFELMKAKLSADEIVEILSAISDLCFFGETEYKPKNKIQEYFWDKLKDKFFYDLSNYKASVENGKKGGIPVWRITDIAAACEKNNIDISDCYESEE